MKKQKLITTTYTHKGSFDLPTFDEAPRDKFIQGIANTYVDCLDIVKKKNADYAVSSDPFLNFRNASVVGVTPERAILVRIMDKISRISNLIDKQADVKDETIQDTIHDAINYLAILKEKIKN